MATKNRKDSKGRVLKTGEDQRKDGRYQYRYTDLFGKRHQIYANDLQELRKKEIEVQKAINEGVSLSNITVETLVQTFMEMKKGKVRESTYSAIQKRVRIIKKAPFIKQKIQNVKPLQIQQWYIYLHDNGYKVGTIKGYHSLLKGSFKMAEKNSLIVKEPTNFFVSELFKDDGGKRKSLTHAQIDSLLDFIKSSEKRIAKPYDDFIVLLETGMRVSEFCGLTLNDLNFEEGYIDVNHQIIKLDSPPRLIILQPKSESGIRKIPMTPKAREALQRIIANRPKPDVEPVVDGYTLFLKLSKYNGKYSPSRASHVEGSFQLIVKSYNKEHPDDPLSVTPHVLRHTFCTELVHKNIGVKNVQYLMGHNDVDVTLNIYADSSYEKAREAMKKLFN
jgi:integrase